MAPLVQIKNHTRPLPSSLMAGYCESFLCKLRGLSLRRSLTYESGLLLIGQKDSRLDAAIHMVGVFFDLGIVWINDHNRVVDRRLARAWVSVQMPSQPARFVLEIAPERLDDFHIGDEVSFEEVVET